MPHATDQNIQKFLKPLNEAMEKYEINTPRRQAAFLAQIAHESGSLQYVEELASGAEYDIGKKAQSLGNTPEDDDDGERYKGRGLIQITGRENYKQLSQELDYDFITHPEDLEKPGAASFSAAWFWWSRHLNATADIDGFERITRKINGGLTNYQDRLKHWANCKAALNVT